MSHVRPSGDLRAGSSADKPAARDKSRSVPPFPIVAIGASAGGLEAFRKLLSNLPENTRMAYVLITHLDPTHESILSKILSRTAKIPVNEAQPGMRVDPGHAYVIRPNATMTIKKETLILVPRNAARGSKPDCINHFMISLAQEYRERAIGVILSGTASDGSTGIEAIKSGGGITFAQDDSAEFKEMPRNAIATGTVDFVLPPEGIARELGRIGRHPYLAQAALLQESAPKPADKDLERIFLLLKRATGVDFAYYKRSTIERRISRQMAIVKSRKLSDYVRYLDGNPPGLKSLHDELLINVTSFFREPEAFEALSAQVFPSFLKERTDHNPIRIWVPGCSSGEEAYSIAISLVEFLEKHRRPTNIQLIATDISERALEKARAGVYESGIQGKVSSDRLKRFFAQTSSGRYQISKAIRGLCIFARQDVTRDPPFSRLDLLSCRNMLIYLGDPLQKRVIPIFHYALKPTGFLMLGSSESVERFASLFNSVDKKHKIYSKRPGSQVEHAPFAPEGVFRQADRVPGTKAATDAGTQFDVGKAADRLLLAEYVPACIVLNDRGQVLEVRGETGPYLRPAPGKASLDVLRMVRDDLVVDLDMAVRDSLRTGLRVWRKGVRFKFEGRPREVEIEVAPIVGPGADGRHLLVLFKESVPETPPAQEKPPKKKGKSIAGGNERDREIAHLKVQLTASREYQQTVAEKFEATNEELRSSTEETLSANEELQSTNEELETSQEELQSLNEELTTLNDELQSKNLDHGKINNDLLNVIAGVNIPLLIVEANLRLRRFTPQAEKLFNLVESDIGRRITDFKPSVGITDLERVLLTVLDTLIPMDQEVQDAEGRWYSMRVRPYRTEGNRIDGAVIIFLEIDALKRSLVEIEEARSFMGAILDSARDPLLVLDEGLRVKMANNAFYETFRETKEQTENVYVCDLGNHQWNFPRLQELLEEIVLKDTRFKSIEVDHEFESIGRRVMLLHARRVVFRPDRPVQVLLTIEDITETREAMAGRLLLASVVDSSQDAIITMSPEHKIMSWNGAAGKIFGYAVQEVLGLTMSTLIPPDQVDEEKKIRASIERKERIPPYDTKRRRKDGNLIDVSLTISPLVETGGKVVGASMIARDICDRVRAGEEIRAVNESLEHRVRARTTELEEALKHLDSFTYTVSHDLRAPLRAMNSYSRILIEDYSGKMFDATAQEYAQRVAEAAGRMDKLVQNLLEYSRLTRDKLPIERIDLNSLLSEILKGMEKEIVERKAEVTVDESLLTACGHRPTLEQVLTNLISNATKFVARGVRPRVHVRVEPRDDWVRLWVEDNGIGISQEHHSRIFGIFEHLNRQEEYPGTGIGLAIVKKAMERMGGAVGLESQVGTGTRFWIELPRGEP